jgi:hypothetical protein
MARFLSIKSSLAAVSAAVLLAACGDSSNVKTVTVTEDIPVITLSPDTIDEAKALSAALVGVTIPLPEGNLFGAGGPVLPADSTLTFTALPPVGAPANAISGFSIQTGTDTFTGYIVAGSTKVCGSGTIGGVIIPLTDPLTCLTIDGSGLNIDADTTGLTGDSTNFAISVVIQSNVGNTDPVTTQVPATVTINPDGSFVLKDQDGNTLGGGDTVEVVTGSTGGTT